MSIVPSGELSFGQLFYALAQDLGSNSPSRRLVPDDFDTIPSLTIFLFIGRQCHTKRDPSENLRAIVAFKNTRVRSQA